MRKEDNKEWKNKSTKNVKLSAEELEDLTFLELEEELEIYRNKYNDYEDRWYVCVRMCVCVYVYLCVY